MAGDRDKTPIKRGWGRGRRAGGRRSKKARVSAYFRLFPAISAYINGGEGQAEIGTWMGNGVLE